MRALLPEGSMSLMYMFFLAISHLKVEASSNLRARKAHAWHVSGSACAMHVSVVIISLQWSCAAGDPDQWQGQDQDFAPWS